MKISINNGDSAVFTGFGHATLKMLANVPKTKHSLLMNRAAPFEMTFGHPSHYVWYGEDSYKIGYTAWESTEIKPEWREQLDKINELWVPNKFCKEVFEKHVDVPVIVFPHGVDETFAPKQRKVEDKIKFLHVGFPAYRKNVTDVINAFIELYGNREDVHLTIKSYENCPVGGLEDHKNITIIPKTTSYAELVNIMHEHHVLLYPSWGEGFGLIPLQAIATGMPAIVTKGWCDYDYYMPDLVIDSELAFSPWLNVHPGKMFKPDYEHFKSLMKYAEENIEMLLDRHYKTAEDVHRDWNWEKVIREHFDSVEARLMV